MNISHYAAGHSGQLLCSLRGFTVAIQSSGARSCRWNIKVLFSRVSCAGPFRDLQCTVVMKG